MSAEDQNHKRKEATNPCRSYVTCSSKRQREIEEEWDAADQANRRWYAQTENICFSKSEHDDRRRRRSALKKPRSIDEDDLSQPWLCGETDPFTARISYFKAAAKIERWAMPTWCHMFNSTLIGSAIFWFDKLPSESVNNYEMLRKAFLGNFSQQKKYIKDPVEIHHIKQMEGESTEAFMERFKAESMHVNGASECMRISGFMHGITNPDLIKKLNDNILKSVDEMMSVTTAFLRGEVATANQSRKKAPLAWRHHETNHKPNFDKRPDFKNRHTSGRRQDRFMPLTKIPKEILAMETVKFKALLPMSGLAESQNKNKFCEFHGDKGHSTDEFKTRGNKGEHGKAAKKGEAPNKEKAAAIFMVQLWQRITRQRVTQSFSASQEISFPPLANSDGQESTIVIEAETKGHLIHRMYVDGGSASKLLYEHCFNRLRSEVKSQMTPATALLLRFSGEISWSLGQISLMVSLGDEEHSTSALINFMVVRSPSPYNNIIGRPGLRKIQAVPSTAHRMLKLPVKGGIVTLRGNTIIPAECRMVTEAPNKLPLKETAVAEGIAVAIHPEYPE
ncbi:reverse transcriptase domain-containing protein [Tanacetum coccineum]